MATGYFRGTTARCLTASTSAYATKGIYFQPDRDIEVSHMLLHIDQAASGNSYYGQIALVSGVSGAHTVTSITGTTASGSTASTDMAVLRVAFASPITLLSGNTYICCAVFNQASGTAVCRPGALVQSTSGECMMKAPGDVPWAYANYNTVGLSVSQSPSASGTNTKFGIGLEGVLA